MKLIDVELGLVAVIQMVSDIAVEWTKLYIYVGISIILVYSCYKLK